MMKLDGWGVCCNGFGLMEDGFEELGRAEKLRAG